ncbi:MAG: hypothetical protein FJ004_10360 [Chloroflexi bacterium]|nr:hypothetical protein [Chloroflexota bacterium]
MKDKRTIIPDADETESKSSQPKFVKTEVSGSVTGGTIITAGRDVTYVETSTPSDELKAVFVAFYNELETRCEIDEAARKEVQTQVKELEATLQSKEPDLGTIQRARKFLMEKGGWLAAAAGTIFSNPSVVKVVETATKRLLGG